MSVAKRLFNWSRGSVAYNLPPWADIALLRVAKNQHATVYTFDDGSQFVQYRDFYYRAWRDETGKVLGAYCDGG